LSRDLQAPELRSYSLGWLRKVALELHNELAEEVRRVTIPGRYICRWQLAAHSALIGLPVQVDPNSKPDCSIRYMHPKSADNITAVVCVASEATTASGGGLERSDSERYSFELVYAPSEATVFFVGSSVHDLKHAYNVVRLSAEALQPEPWQRGAHELSAAVPGFKVCSALSYLYRAHSLSNLHKLHPRLRRALIPGDTCVSSPAWPDAEAEPAPWLPMQASGLGNGSALRDLGRVSLNGGQQDALRGIHGPVTLVQGPPGTGKSSFILEAFLQRMPEDARMLACTATNKAIDSLVAKFESAGIDDILAVGSKDRMGERTQHFTLEQRITRDRSVHKAEQALAAATLKRELCEEKVAPPSLPPSLPRVGREGGKRRRDGSNWAPKPSGDKAGSL